MKDKSLIIKKAARRVKHPPPPSTPNYSNEWYGVNWNTVYPDRQKRILRMLLEHIGLKVEANGNGSLRLVEYLTEEQEDALGLGGEDE